MNTTEFLAIATAIIPDREAIVFEGKRISFAALQERVNRLANGLAGLGVGPGDRVATLQVNSNQQVEACLATAKLDAVYVPLNFRARAAELSYMLNDSGAKVLLAGSRYADHIRSFASDLHSVKRFVALDTDVEDWLFYEHILSSASDTERFPEGDNDDLTVILFTAGTTGKPKGVMLSHESFSSYVLSNVTPADPEEAGRNILTVPLYHVAAVQAVMSAIYGGRTLVIQKQFEPVEWMQLVEQERASRALMVPTMLKMLMDHPEFGRYDLSSLDIITYGAAPMPLDVIRRAIKNFPDTQFINAFGQTETAATITMLPPDDHVLDGTIEEVETKLRRLTSIGKPLEDIEVRIVDEDGVPVDVGDIGEIVAGGTRLMKGYWHQKAATTEAIRDGWLYTGDRGYFDEDGYIYLAGRAKDFIKRGGEMVSPQEVEEILHSHPAVDEAAVIGVPDVDWGERIRAIVVLKDGQNSTDTEISDYCRDRLASFKKPESIVFVDQLPRNALGKVLKRLLREEYGEALEEVWQTEEL